MIRILLKLWPAFAVIFAYLFWVFVINRMILKKRHKSKIIDAQFTQSTKDQKPFSLENKRFIAVLYLGLIALIISFLLLAVQNVKSF